MDCMLYAVGTHNLLTRTWQLCTLGTLYVQNQ